MRAGRSATTRELTCEIRSASGVGLGHLQEEMLHILILLEGRQHGVINLLNYLFWVILFKVIGSDNGETSAYEPCGVAFMTVSSALCFREGGHSEGRLAEIP